MARTSLTINMSREQVIARLRENHALAVKIDEEAAREHRKREVEALKAIKVAMREALKWDWPTMKAKSSQNYYGDNEVSVRVPSKVRHPQCPLLIAPQFADAIRLLEVDSRKTMRLSVTSDFGRLVAWKPPAEEAKRTVCD